MRLVAKTACRAFRALALMGAALPLPLLAHADNYSKTVAAGSSVKLGGYNSLNPDCTSKG